MWYNINMRISEPKQNYRTIKCVHILVMTIVVIRNHTAPTILEKAWARHISAIAKPDGRYVPKTVDSKGDNVEVVVFD